MLLERIYDEDLAQASYVIGCQAKNEAIVVDPRRDVQEYLDLAAHHGMTITHVTETHIHADYLSGTRELAHATGAQIHLSGEGGEDWAYGFEGNLLKDGDTVTLGNITVEAVHTPGHTPDRPSAHGAWGAETPRAVPRVQGRTRTRFTCPKTTRAPTRGRRTDPARRPTPWGRPHRTRTFTRPRPAAGGAHRAPPPPRSRDRTPRDDAPARAHGRHGWRRPGSNRRPPACKAGALPAELSIHRVVGGHYRGLGFCVNTIFSFVNRML